MKMKNAHLIRKLSRHADKGTMFHYMDSLNRSVMRDPLLVNTSKQTGHVVASVLMLAAVIALFILAGVYHVPVA